MVVRERHSGDVIYLIHDGVLKCAVYREQEVAREQADSTQPQIELSNHYDSTSSYTTLFFRVMMADIFYYVLLCKIFYCNQYYPNLTADSGNTICHQFCDVKESLFWSIS